jgi:hypothetical protein
MKIINAQQAKVFYNYENIKEKLLKTNSAIWFNKVCRQEQLQPIYTHVNVSGTSRQSNNTKKAAVRYRLSQEIKFLYRKKSTLNTQLYKAHLEGANYWISLWPIVQSSISQKVSTANETR